MVLKNFMVHKATGLVFACYRDGDRENRKVVGKNFKLKWKARFVANPLNKE